MAVVSLFWNTNMAAVTSCENALYRPEGNHGGMQRGHLWSRAAHLHELFLTSLLELRANGRNNSQRWQLLANNVPSVCTGLKFWPVSNFAQQLPTTSSNMQQGVQTDATCNIQQCCVRFYGGFRACSHGGGEPQGGEITCVYMQSYNPAIPYLALRYCWGVNILLERNILEFLFVLKTCMLSQ